MPTERLETELAMHEEDCISVFEEIFRRGSTSGPYRNRNASASLFEDQRITDLH